MTYFNEFGQARLGWNVGTPSGGITPSTLWNSIYSVYNADSTGSSSLKTSLYAAYNGESNANDSYSTLNGTAQGGLTYTTGKIGNAFTFNGSNAYVSLPNNSLNFTGDFSVSLWLYRQPLAGGMLVNNWYNGSTPFGWLIQNNNGVIKFLMGNGTSSPVCNFSSSILTSNVWNFVTITKTATSAKIYINGVLNTSTTLSSSVVYTTTHYPMIGAAKYDTGLPNFYMENGSKLDALSIWQKELTQSEITELYNSGNGSQYITDNFYKPTTNDALNTYNGTAQGGLTYGVGKVGTAFQFNGTTSLVSLPTNSFKFTSSEDFSISLWIWMTSPNQNNQIIFSNSTYDGTNQYGYYLLQSGGVLLFRIGSSSGLVSLSTPVDLVDRWSHITITRKASTGTKMYINGTLVTSNSDTRNPNYLSTMVPSIGVGYWGGIYGNVYYCNNGTKIDALNIWQKELTQSEITQLYNSGTGKQYPN